MALTMRPTGLGSGAYQDNVDYNVFSGEWLIGRIYERKGFRMSSVEPRAAIISKRRLATANSGAKADMQRRRLVPLATFRVAANGIVIRSSRGRATSPA